MNEHFTSSYIEQWHALRHAMQVLSQDQMSCQSVITLLALHHMYTTLLLLHFNTTTVHFKCYKL